jgi:hypothetical protein
MPDPKRVLIVTVVPVGPRQQDIARQHFAVHLASAYEQPARAFDRLPLPWSWSFGQQPTIVGLVASAPDKTGRRRYGSFKVPLAIGSGGDLRTPVLTRKFDALGRIKLWFESKKDLFDPFFRDSSQQPPEGKIDLAQQLAVLGTQVGSIGQELFLVGYFQLPAVLSGDLTNPKDVVAIIAAPIVDGASPSTPLAFDPMVDSLNWPYSGADLTAHLRALSVAQPSGRPCAYDGEDQPQNADPFVNLGDYWIRTKAASGWSGELPGKTAQATDRVARFVDFRRHLQQAIARPVDPTETPKLATALAVLEHYVVVAPALFADWTTPATPVDTTSDFDRIFSGLLEGKLPLLVLGDGERTQLRDRLLKFAKDLIADGPGTWSKMLDAEVGKRVDAGRTDGKGDDGTRADAISASAATLCHEALLLQWDYAVTNARKADDPLVVKWGGALKQDGIRAVFGVDVSARFRVGPAWKHRAAAAKLALSISRTVASSGSPRAAAIAETTAALSGAADDLKNHPYHPAAPPLDGGAWDVFVAQWKLYLAAFAKDLWASFPDAAEAPFSSRSPAPLVRGTAPAPLVLQVGAVTDLAALGTNRDDVWRKIAGVGLAVRDGGPTPNGKNDNPWRLVTTARVATPDDKSPRGPDGRLSLLPLFDEVAVVPKGINFRDGLRHPFVSYAQRSLTAASALDDAVAQFAQVSDPNGASTGFGGDGASPMPKLDSRFAFLPVNTVDAADDLRLTLLKFGRPCEMAAFVIDKSGGLPSELAGSKPWIFAGAGKWTVKAAPSVVESFDYSRDVAVGQVRLTALDQGPDLTDPKTFPKPVDWPKIPDDVVPLSSEVLGLRQPPSPDTPSRPAHEYGPLLLVAPPHGAQASRDSQHPSTLRLGLKPPTAHLDVLERSTKQRDLIENANRFYWSELAKRDPNDQKVLVDHDVAFDDPSVAGYAVVLESFDWPTAKWTARDVNRWACLSATPLLQPWLKIDCSIGDRWLVDDPHGNGAILKLNADGTTPVVARIGFHALVSKKDARFPAGFFPADLPKPPAVPNRPTNAFDDVFVLPGATVVVEVTGVALPGPEQLWRWLAVDAHHDRRHVALSLRPTGDDLADQAAPLTLAALRNISRIRLSKQPWRWQGRPLDQAGRPVQPSNDSPLDDTTAGQAARDTLSWEQSAFATLDPELDAIAIPVGHLPSVLQGSPAVAMKSLEGFYLDRVEDARAQYTRYGLEVVSRYAGVYSDHASVVAQTPGLNGRGWKRAAFANIGPRPAKPVIKAIVPLTRPTTPQSLPPLLVLLEDAAFAQCGVSEWIEAEVVQTHSYRTGQKMDLLEIANDPILTPNAQVRSAASPRAFTVSGPFGYTFDDVAVRQPLFAASGYLLDAPTDPSKDLHLQPWDFVRIRMRRIADWAAPGLALESDWTQPTWVQFLPSSSFGYFPDDPDGRPSATSPRPGVYRLPMAANEIIDKSKRFTYGVLVTRGITDVRGDTSHEVYEKLVQGACVLEGHNTFVEFTMGAVDAKIARWLRIIEVQVTPDWASSRDTLLTDEADFWRHLLELDAGAERGDARYRITRISPRTRLSP